MISLSLTLSLMLAAGPCGPAEPTQDRSKAYLEFQKNFKKAMEINATTQMAQMVRKEQEYATWWVIETAEFISTRPSDELEDRMKALRVAWKTSMETGFADKMYDYFSLLSLNEERSRRRLKAKTEYDDLRDDYQDNLEKKAGPTFVLMSQKFRKVAMDFESVEDHYYASQCWVYFGTCFGKEMRGDDADLYKAYEGAASCVRERLAIELKDRIYLANKQTADHLKANGYDKEASDEEGGGGTGPGAKPGAAKAPKASGAELVAPLVFELVEELDDCLRPSYFTDGLYPMWSTVYLTKEGSKGKVVSLDKLSPNFYRTGANEVMVDTDGDEEGDLKVPLTGNMELLQFQIGEGDEKRDWACMAIVGMEKDLYQGFEQHLGVSDYSVSLYVFNAASMVGEVNGEKVQILDDNGDGVYGSPPKLWAYAGLTKGKMQPDMDCVRIGRSKRAQPWSEYQKVGKEWFRLVVSSKGDELIATPVSVQTGTLKMKFKGGKPTWVVVKGKGKYEGCYYDLLAGGSKGVEVPVGSYELFCGDLRKGKKRQTAKTLILPGEDMESWSVEAGDTTTIELGGPFSLDFAFEMAGEGVRVQGGTVVVVGVAGEQYERPWNCRPAPDVSWRKAGARKGNKAERMKLITDQYVMMEVENGWSKVWFPLDCEFDVNNFDAVELQLAEKKNALFGRLESNWKE